LAVRLRIASITYTKARDGPRSVGHPTWSPDGSRIAFEGSIGSDTDPGQTWDIYSVAVCGSGMTNLTNTPDGSETQPAWSWVTDRIAFVESGPAEGALLTMSSAGTDPVTVFSGELGPANPVGLRMAR
jgi:Tol biopolymer transport system component